MPGGAAGGQRSVVRPCGGQKSRVCDPSTVGRGGPTAASVLYTSVEGGIVYFGFGELLAEKSQQLPVLAYLLLQDRSDMGVGGVGRQGEDGPGRGWARGTAATRAALVAVKVVSMLGVQAWAYLRVR